MLREGKSESDFVWSHIAVLFNAVFLFGADEVRGCVVVVRPDQYVACIGGLGMSTRGEVLCMLTYLFSILFNHDNRLRTISHV